MLDCKYSLFFLFFPISVLAQFAAPAGQLGSTAIGADSNIIINWAQSCKINLGWKDIAIPDSGFVSIGDSLSAVGPALKNGVVSLGDGGSAICFFDPPISDGPSWDFAVFENAFDDAFLELAFVEVSSDGEHFVRFPATSLIDTSQQTETFGLTDARLINNLAGKYRVGFGTPFDLAELKDSVNLDIQSIKYIKIIDVVGSINPEFATYDNSGRAINDPYPTPFPSGGFDLDAIGVIHQARIVNTQQNDISNEVFLYPNPVTRGQDLWMEKHSLPFSIQIFSISGELLSQQYCQEAQCKINVSNLPNGMVLVKGIADKGFFIKKIVVQSSF